MKMFGEKIAANLFTRHFSLTFVCTVSEFPEVYLVIYLCIATVSVLRSMFLYVKIHTLAQQCYLFCTGEKRINRRTSNMNKETKTASFKKKIKILVVIFLLLLVLCLFVHKVMISAEKK